MSITLKEDLSHITSILNETFQIVPFKRDYDTTFGRICISGTIFKIIMMVVRK